MRRAPRVLVLLLAVLCPLLVAADPFYGSTSPKKVYEASDTVAGIRKVTTAGPWYFVAPHNTNVGITNVTAATAEVNANRNAYADWTGLTKCRICAQLASGNLAGLKLGEQYSLNDGSTWFFLDGTADGDLGSEGPQVSLAATGWVCSSYTTLATAAAAPVKLRAITDDGDGAADPAFIEIYTECR